MPCWSDRPANVGTMAAYRQHIQQVLHDSCLASWPQRAYQKNAEVPYLSFAPSCGGLLRDVPMASLPYDVLVGVKSLCKLRLGAITLRHIDGKRSAAQEQQCWFCRRWPRNGLVHTIETCHVWSDFRSDFSRALGCPHHASIGTLTKCFLSCDPQGATFTTVVRWSIAIDEAAARPFLT